MSKYCYLCASDEGILLDIFGDGGKTLRENIETCLSVKIKQSDAPSTKICHKCAWELDCCGKFVQKYKQSRDIKESRASTKQGNCILCRGTGKKNQILELRKENALNNFQCKIHELFSDNFSKESSENLSICLDCRYNVDVLFDLKNIYRTTPDKLKSIIQNGVKLSDLPKTRTRIVSRKTTEIPLPRLNGGFSNDTDTSTSSTMSTKRKRGRPRKDSVKQITVQFRTCEECNTSVEHGIDMYRYHRTGMIVCRDCWLTMDPEKMTNGKRKKLTNTRNSTKLCAVFLKDVLSNPSKYKTVYKMEKDEHGNTTFLITDESSENEEKEKTPPKRLRDQTSVTSVEMKKPNKRLAPMKNEAEPAKKSKGKMSSNESEPSNSRLRTRNGISGSETATSAISTTTTTTTTATTITRTRRISGQSAMPVKSAHDSDPGASKKPGKKLGRPPKAGKTVSSSEKSPTGSSNEKPAMRTTRRTRSSSFTSRETISPINHLATLPENMPATGETKIPEVETKRVKRISAAALKSAKSDSELEKPYICTVCGIGCKNKLIGMAHQLTHAKQPEVKLQRVVIPEIVVKVPSVELVTIEEPAEQSHDVTSTSDHKQELNDVPEATVEESTLVVDRVSKEQAKAKDLKEKSTPEVVKVRRDQKDLEGKSTPEVTEITRENDDLEEKSSPEIMEIGSDNDDSEEKSSAEIVEVRREQKDLEEISTPEVAEVTRGKEDLDEKLGLYVTEVSKDKEDSGEEKSSPEVTEISKEKEGSGEEKSRPEVVEINEEKDDSGKEKSRPEVVEISEEKEYSGNEKSRSKVVEMSNKNEDSEREKPGPEVVEIRTDKEVSEQEKTTAAVEGTSEEKEYLKDERSQPEVTESSREKEGLEEAESRLEVMEVSEDEEDAEGEKSRPEVTEIGDKDDLEEKLRTEVMDVSEDEEETEGKKLSLGVRETSPEKENLEGEKETPEVSEVSGKEDLGKTTRPEVIEDNAEKEDLDEKSRPEVTEDNQEKHQFIEAEKSPLPEAKSPKIDETVGQKKSNENNENVEVEEVAEEITENSAKETQNTEESTRMEENVDNMIDENEDKINENEDKIDENDDKINEDEDKIDENENNENDEITKKKNDENENTTQNPEEKTLESLDVTVTSKIEKAAEKSESVLCEDTEKETGNIESLAEVESTKMEEIESMKMSVNGDATDIEANEPEVAKIDVEKEIEANGQDLNVTMSANSKETPAVCVESSQGEKSEENCVKDKFIVPTETMCDRTDDKSIEAESNENTEISKTTETETKIVKDSVSHNVASDVIKEVFDLASAEVKKRLEKAKTNDENCVAPISETLENISREIQDGADMPSLELEDQSSNIKS